MKLFNCPNCGHRLYFENSVCLSCGNALVYDPHGARFELASTEGVFTCANASECDCNWKAGDGVFCIACALNKTIPDLSLDANRKRWARVERAKRRAVYSLLAFGLPVGPKASPDDEVGIAFDFLADIEGDGPGGEHILTGHDNGLITLNVAEADSSEREKMRAEMGENYRTLLGHFRHELGHYYWDRLVRDDPDWLARCRELFGDETADYAQALQTHYANGAPADWQSSFISAYATSHPWEDWAESWAHYLHITDTLEMVTSLNMRLGDLETLSDTDTADSEGGDIGEPVAFDVLLERWLVLSEASNSINRCMGLPDLYPFVISPVIGEKLRFVHELIASLTDGSQASRQP
jgi:hypothetical protein